MEVQLAAVSEALGHTKATAIPSPCSGNLNLIDLAGGSERVERSGSEGKQLEEAININRSLSALGDLLHHLREKSSHTPYRNSKLTYLLQDITLLADSMMCLNYLLVCL